MKWLKALLRREAPETPPASFPTPYREAEWMRARLAWALRKDRDRAVDLFDPTSGEYLPLTVHAGTFFSDQVREDYRQLKREHIELVREAADRPRAFSCSRIADPEDLSAHAHRIAVRGFSR